jgi:plastocyanin
MASGLHRILNLGAAATLVGMSAFYGPSIAGAVDANRIVVKDFMFAPNSVAVGVGSTVTWTNLDDEPHTVVSDAGLFKSGGLDTNESFEYQFNAPGIYHFTCSIHPRMVGTVVVR